MFAQKDFELPGSHVSRTNQEQGGLRQLRGQLGLKKQHGLAGVLKSKLPSKVVMVDESRISGARAHPCTHLTKSNIPNVSSLKPP